jgi:hypothetical protein
MRTLLVIATFFVAYWAIDSMPTALAIPFGLLMLAGILAGAIALAVKWVRNV